MAIGFIITYGMGGMDDDVSIFPSMVLALGGGS